MNADEHIGWCKQRALEYIKEGNAKDAIASMISDLNKHPETKCNEYVAALGLICASHDDLIESKRWIEGFR
jgi:hypothetical protein